MIIELASYAAQKYNNKSVKLHYNKGNLVFLPLEHI